MKKRFLWMVVACVVAVSAQAQMRSGHFFRSLKGQNVKTVNAEQYFSQWFHLPDGTEWRLASRSTDDLGMERIEYRQYVGGVEVEHSQILLHAKDGIIQTTNGTVMEAAQTPATRRAGSVIYKEGTPTDLLGRTLLLVYTDGGYRYAVKSLAASGRQWIYTDVENGETLKTVPTRSGIAPEGTTTTIKGKSLYSGEVDLDVTKGGDGIYYLYDPKRNIHTLNAAYIPTVKDLDEAGKLFDYFPQGDLTQSLFESAPEEQKAWGEMVSDMIKNNQLDKFKDWILDNTQYISQTTPVFSAYKLDDIRIDRLAYKDEEGSLVQLEPTEDLPVALEVVIRYGADNPGQSRGVIEDMPVVVQQWPYTLALSEIHEVLPKEGVTIDFYMADPSVETPDIPDLPDLPDFPGLPDIPDYPDLPDLPDLPDYPDLPDFPDMPDMGDDGDGDDQSQMLLVARVAIKPSAEQNGRVDVSNENIAMQLTYQESGDPTVDIHWGMARTLDFYQEAFNRNSYDGKGSPVYNLVYLLNKDDETMLCSPLTNAAAIASQSPYPMVYGMGGYDMSSQDFTMRPVVELSVMSHEFTHIITGMTAKLENIGESGALDESFSDLMGISVKKYVHGNDADWQIGGSGLMIGAPNMRDMAHPENSGDGTDPCPDTYQGKNWADPNDLSLLNDFGGIHSNCGVQNKWYYLLTDGDKGTNDNGDAYDVQGLGIEKSRQIAYRTLTVYATRQSQFADIRPASIQAAKDLYGDESVEAKTVAEAWDAVGVYDATPDGIEEMKTVTATVTDVIYDLQGRRVSRPTTGIYIQGGKKVVVRK